MLVRQVHRDKMSVERISPNDLRENLRGTKGDSFRKAPKLPTAHEIRNGLELKTSCFLGIRGKYIAIPKSPMPLVQIFRFLFLLAISLGDDHLAI